MSDQLNGKKRRKEQLKSYARWEPIESLRVTDLRKKESIVYSEIKVFEGSLYILLKKAWHESLIPVLSEQKHERFNDFSQARRVEKWQQDSFIGNMYLLRRLRVWRTGCRIAWPCLRDEAMLSNIDTDAMMIGECWSHRPYLSLMFFLIWIYWCGALKIKR